MTWSSRSWRCATSAVASGSPSSKPGGRGRPTVSSCSRASSGQADGLTAIPLGSIDKGVDKTGSSEADTHWPTGLSRLDRPTVMSGSRRRCLAVGVAAEVKNKLSVVEVVGETVSLKKAGTTYKGLCPFHGEKTPSFVVTPQRENWHCFGCGLGGDIFSFVMQRDGVTFPEALRTLAQRAGVEIDERTQREDAHKARLRSVLDSAIAFYHAVLTASNAGEAGPRLPPRSRLHRRHHRDLPARLGARRLGPDDPHARRPSATSAPEELVEVGLASPRQSGRGGVYDKFRARVIFPIRDQNGHAVGLGGRLLEGDGPKYLNSPATPLFDKSRTLYLIDKAKGPIRKLGPGGHRRGLHRRADGPPGRLRQRRGQPRHRPDAGPGRAADPLRQRGSCSPTTSTRPARRRARSA